MHFKTVITDYTGCRPGNFLGLNLVTVRCPICHKVGLQRSRQHGMLDYLDNDKKPATFVVHTIEDDGVNKLWDEWCVF